MKKLFVILVAMSLLAIMACSSGGSGDSGDGGGTTQGGVYLKTAAGTPTGVPASATIGPAGGSLDSADGRITLTVPANAVAKDTTFTITPISNPADNALATYRLEPDGATFSKPVTLLFKVPEAGVSFSGIEVLAIACHQADGSWLFLSDTMDSTNKTISIETNHFTAYSLLAGFQLKPHYAFVDVDKTVSLQVTACTDPENFNNITGVSLQNTKAGFVFRGNNDVHAYECRQVFYKGASSAEWQVNSIANGNSTFGTLSPSDFSATFTAPHKKPNPETVQVSTRFTDSWLSKRYSEKVLLVSQIEIGESVSYSGTFTVTVNNSGGPSSWTAKGSDVTWTPDPDHQGEYIVKGYVTPDATTYTVNDATCTLTETKKPFEFDSGNIMTVAADKHTIYWAIIQPDKYPMNWAARCCNTKGECNTGQFLRFEWSSACGSNWAILDETVFPNTLQGSWKSGCLGIPNEPSATVSWTFNKQ
ncbi:MAG: hypothetical protein ABFD91_10495 [Anaerohalosphaeraceae bacterium]